MLAQRATSTAVVFTRRDAGRFVAAALLLIAVIGGTLGSDILPPALNLAVGERAPQDIRAPRARDYRSDVLTKRAQDEARAATLPQYDYTPTRALQIAADQLQKFEAAVRPVDTAFSPSISPDERPDLLQTVLPGLSPDARETLIELLPPRWTAVRAEAARVLDLVEQEELKDPEVADKKQNIRDDIAGGLTTAEKALAAELITPLIVANSSFDAELTRQRAELAAAAVEPQIKSWQRDQLIVEDGAVITAEQLEAIEEFGLNQGNPDIARLGGWMLLAALIVGLLLGWLWRFRRELWHRNNVLLLLALLLVFSVFAFKLTADRPWLPYVLPAAAVAILLTVLIDATTAMLVAGLLAVVAGAVNGTQVELSVYTFLGSLAGIVSIRRGDRLGVFIQAGIAVFIAQAIVVTVFSLLGERDLTGIVQLWAASAVSAGGAAVAAVGSFAVLGNLFGIMTVFQMLELGNPSQPLLRRLLVETPGTYHHSIMVGNLAERAAEAIGGDPLLARVAAFYHDIGKLANPVAFIENQSGGENVHDQLEPEVSAQVLKQHVADGIDLAYRAGLPKALIAFIPQHHGTAVMSYFLARAREEAAAPYGGLATSEGRKAAEAIDVRRYRHAGPKPQTREAAIIMLADGVEASVRSLASRDEPTIRAMVTRIIEERLADGQFDECDLTLRDIERIREAFVGQLLGMYHQRIAYPQNKVVELESRRMAAGAEHDPGP
jgi:putative nucleotidyltransferase with HDIG domain